MFSGLIIFPHSIEQNCFPRNHCYVSIRVSGVRKSTFSRLWKHEKAWSTLHQLSFLLRSKSKVIWPRVWSVISPLHTNKKSTTMNKLTAKSPAKQLLIRKLLSGEITGKEEPKTVWESDPIFKQHKMNTFRTHYNQLRKNPPQQESRFLHLSFVTHSNIFKIPNLCY